MPGKDIYVVVQRPEDTSTLRVFEFGGARTVPMTGFYKTILHWLKCLFTEIGSDMSDPEYGTPLAELVGGNMSSRHDLRDIIALSLDRATAITKRYQRDGEHTDEEMLSAVTLNNIVMYEDGAEVYVTITNAAGKVLTLTVPVGTSPPPQTA